MAEQLTPLARIEKCAAEYQGIVADCLVWFEGFTAAFAGKETWQQPTVPDLQEIRNLNATLQELMRDKANV